MEERVEFKRNIGLFMAVMIGIGAMMGPGIFALPGELAHMVGPLGILVYLAMGTLTVFTALNYAELGAGIPIAGGGYSFVGRTMPKPVAFLTGWFLWIGNTVACAMYAIIFALTIRAYFWPGASIVFLTTATTIVFALVNFRGMSESIKIITIMNIVELVILVGIAGLGLFKVEAANLTPLAPMGYAPFIPGMALIYISYVGFDLITVASEEIINPGKTVPRAILITLGVGIAIYVFVVGVMMGSVHYTELAKSDVPFIFSAERILGPWGRTAGIVATIMASLSAFSITLGASARILYALGRDRHFPVTLAKLHGRYQTPHVALFVCTIIVMVFSATGIIKFVASVADFGYLMGLGIVNCAVIALHKKMPNLRRPFKGFLFPWVPILGALSCWAFVPALEARSLVLGGILTLIGGGIYFIQPANRHGLFKISDLSKRVKQWIILIRRRRMRVLIIGGGRHARNIANQLLMKDEHRMMFRSAEHQITFIEKDENQCQDLEQRYNVPVFQGDGTKKELLKQVGLNNFDVAITATGSDNQNLIAALQVKRLNVDPVIALVQEPDYMALLEENNIVAISTHKASAIMIENYLERPDVAELFEIGKGEGGLAGVLVKENAKVIGESIQNIALSRDCIVAAVIRDKHFLVPRGDTEICQGDRVLFAGLTPAIKKAREMFMVEVAGKAARGGSLAQLVDRLKLSTRDELDRELQGIIKKTDKDPFDELVERAFLLDFKNECSFESIVHDVSTELAARLSISVDDLRAGFVDSSRLEITPVSDGIAIPHLRFSNIKDAELVLVRSLPGSYVTTEDLSIERPAGQLTYAFFFLVSPDKDPAVHLRILARLAECVSKPFFMKEWLTARNEDELKETLLEKEHFVSIRLRQDTKASSLIGQAIHDLQMPEGMLIAVIHRKGKIVIPHGRTVLQDEDRLTIVGDPTGIREFSDLYDEGRAVGD